MKEVDSKILSSSDQGTSKETENQSGINNVIERD